MFLDTMINRANSSLKNYPEVYEYLTIHRDISDEEIKKFRLGCTVAPQIPVEDSDDYRNFMEDTRDKYFLKNKVLIPLENAAGYVNGVITRESDPDAKYRYRHFYLSEGKKIGVFFGLPQAIPHIIRTGTVFVVEGAFDCISLSRFIPNTVSTLTSDINEEQMWTLKMISERIVLVFDPDEPGRKGVEWVRRKYGDKGILSRELPHGDPNYSLVKLGEEGFKKVLKRQFFGLSEFNF